MSKLGNLYQIFSRNAISLLLLAALLFCASFTDVKKKTNSKIKTIVIDPGHGGHDPGNLGTGRYKKTEKHVALAISLKLGDYIENFFPDINVIYTRKTNDKFLKLGERTQLANDNNADLFISVHCDAFTSPDAFGTGVFVMGMSKLKANMDIAMKENAVIYLEDDYKENYDGFDPNSPESYIVFSLTQNTHLDQSLHIAEKIEQEFISLSNSKCRGVKQAPFYVISRVNMPSILIETGFLTNPEEEDFLQSEKGQDYLASAIFRAFSAYKESFEGTSSEAEENEPIVANEEAIKKLTHRKEITTDKLIFKVQIGTYLKSMMNDTLFKEINAEQLVENKIFKYYVGNETNMLSVDKLKDKLKYKGFKGAFIVAFYNGKRISTKEAIDLQTKMNNHE